MPVATNATPNVIGGTPVTNGIATQPMPLATHSIIQNNSGYGLNSTSSQSFSADYLNIVSNGAGGINATSGNIDASYSWIIFE